MWRRYEPPAEPEPEDPEQPARWPVLPDATQRARQPQQASRSPYSSNRRRPLAAAGASGKGSTGGLLVGMVGVLATVAIAFGTAGSVDDAGSEQSGWDACIDSYADDEPGLITPADLCEIGHERPPGYTEYDDYEWEPGQDYDSWSDVEDGDGY